MANILTKVFGSANERALKRLTPMVDKINEEFEKLEKLSDTELQKKTEEFKTRIQEEISKYPAGPERRIAEEKVLLTIIPEVYAVVKDVCRRLLGKKWLVTEQEWEWNMVPYDVQLVGAIILHERPTGWENRFYKDSDKSKEAPRGHIAEMATGEGKTLAATMPLYLNSLTGRGCHLITVNDYLARRDREWMGGVYDFLGVTVGCIQGGMTPEERKPQYDCDITYGTNNEFGFDYLRDNMTWRPEDRVQRSHYYAIVDEVDSVLIDEARTPLIISGPVEHTINREYARLKPNVERVVHRQTLFCNQLLADAVKLLKEDKEKEAGIKLLQAQKGDPKNRKLFKLKEDGKIAKLIEDTERELMAEEGSQKMGIRKEESRLHRIQQELYYTIDEKGHSVNYTDEGRELIAPGDPDFFTLPDLSQELPQIDQDSKLSPRERLVAKQAIQRKYAEKSERVHAINQLSKAYSLFKKDVAYVIQNNKVLIVDEFTGRLMPGRRYSDGLHQALEAKEGVKVESETQTLATITLQNYFRMYEKLAGMTGTAETEKEEFWKIYKMEVLVIPTNKPVRRIEHNDVIYKTRREKLDAAMKEIEEMHHAGRPVLVGTVSVSASETLSRMLQRKGIPHQVLNARYHQKEAEIIAQAGQAGKVTIATNMAGRGTDIKLGKDVVKCEKCCINCNENCSKCTQEKKMIACLSESPCGLHILGTERHESRRIDRQLRGRCARQGDPGSARFYLSLEDNLMRLFGSDKIAGAMERWGPSDGEPIQHNLVTRAIEGAQKRVERFNFGIREHLLKYDDVMNIQREAIYRMRNDILQGKDVSAEVKEMIEMVIDIILENHITGTYAENWDWEDFYSEIRDVFLIEFRISEGDKETIKPEELKQRLQEAISTLYKRREEEIGAETMRDLERQVMLHIIDKNWREHLYELDALKEGIGLRGYAQRDPAVEYQRESGELFEQLLDNIDREVVRNLFGLRYVSKEEREREVVSARLKAFKPDTTQPKPQPAMAQAPVATPAGLTPGPAEQPTPAPLPGLMPGMPPPEIPRDRPVIITYKRGDKKVGRNDPCPCGSGKKYKHCCGKIA